MTEINIDNNVKLLLALIVGAIFTYGMMGGGVNMPFSQGTDYAHYHQGVNTNDLNGNTNNGNVNILNSNDNKDNNDNNNNQWSMPTVEPYIISSVSQLVEDKWQKLPVSGIKVEVLPAPASLDTKSIIDLAADADRTILDNQTTNANGKVTFTNIVKTDTPYVYSFRNSSYYDFVKAETIPAPGAFFGITAEDLTDASLYEVGTFADIDGSVSITPANCFNITGKTDKTTCQITGAVFGISITSDGLIKDPALELRVPETKTLTPGAVRAVRINYQSGTNLGIPTSDLTNRISAGPMELKGTWSDANYPGVEWLQPGDLGTYTILLKYDPATISSIGVASAELDLTLDDLGGYNTGDIVSKGTKATAQTYPITWVE